MKKLNLITISRLAMAALFTLAIGVANAQVNINTATAKELTTLSGIGEKKAAAIIDYRTKNGDFKSVSDLSKVSGIGEQTVKSLSKEIVVSGKTDLSKVSTVKKADKK